MEGKASILPFVKEERGDDRDVEELLYRVESRREEKAELVRVFDGLASA